MIQDLKTYYGTDVQSRRQWGAWGNFSEIFRTFSEVLANGKN